MSGHVGNVIIREAHTIWHEQGGWFDARWHFSFDRYSDPEQEGVGALLTDPAQIKFRRR